jgi:DNA (cytosine-5)-methyltransferase 1
MGLDEVLTDLEGEGYTARPFIIPAGAVQRNHARERIWIVAYNERTRAELETHTDSRQERRSARNKQRKMVSQGNWKSCSKGIESSRVLLDGTTFSVNGQSEPLFLGGTSRIPDRMDRRKSIGNSVVPQIPEILGAAILAV